MKKHFILILIALGSQTLNGQKLGFSITGGIGTYQLEELKSYQAELIERLPVAPRTFDQFPPYVNFKIQLFKQMLSGFKYGMNYTYSGSGIHSNYTDYSGFLNLDQTIEAYQIGANLSYRLLYSKKIEAHVFAEPRLAYVRDRVNYNITTNNYFENHSLRLSGVSPYMEFGLNTYYNASTFSLGLEGGYLLDPGTALKQSRNLAVNPSISLEPAGKLRAQMSGFRVGIKLVVWLKTIDSEELN